eukprot:scaffold9256_cov113-Isochrysis_galbana.AAC.2
MRLPICTRSLKRHSRLKFKILFSLHLPPPPPQRQDGGKGSDSRGANAAIPPADHPLAGTHRRGCSPRRTPAAALDRLVA